MTIDSDALSARLRRLMAEEGQGRTEVHEALQRIVDACVDIFGVAGSGIMLADEQNMTRYVAASDGPGRILESAESETGQGACTEAFVFNRAVDTTDLAAETDRWPDLAAAVLPHNVHAVLGVPVRVGGVPVGTLDVYRTDAHEWDDSERAAIAKFSEVVETTLTSALQAHSAAELADQLQYALDYRIVIERGVGYLMASERVDAVTAFNRLRRVARSSRTKIGEVAERLLATGRLPRD